MLEHEAQQRIIEYLRASSLIVHAGVECWKDIESAAQLITTAFLTGHKLLICGNGGSAAQSQHMAAELVPLSYPAIALTTDTSLLTAWSNDEGFDSVFAQQVKVLGKPGDVLLAISTSWQSVNIHEAVKMATPYGLGIIALAGSGGMDQTYIDNNFVAAIRVPSSSVTHVQESHLAICHVICELVVEGMREEKKE